MRAEQLDETPAYSKAPGFTSERTKKALPAKAQDVKLGAKGRLSPSSLRSARLVPPRLAGSRKP